MSKRSKAKLFFKRLEWPLIVSGSKHRSLIKKVAKHQERASHLSAENDSFSEHNLQLQNELSSLKVLRKELTHRASAQAERIKAYQDLGKSLGFDLEEELKYQHLLSSSGSILQNRPLGITSKIQQRFLDDVAVINNQEKAKPHSSSLIQFDPQQQQMIFSNSPATNVLAGAGSGKSTTLVLRVILFNLYLGIPFHKICVCTFTRESRKDFINKLVKRMQQWRESFPNRSIPKVDIEDARAVVRTFHSLAFSLQKSYGDKDLFFSWGNQKPESDDPEGYDIENLNAVGGDTKTPKENLEDQLQRSLYKKLYSEDHGFKKDVIALFRHSLIWRRKREKKGIRYSFDLEKDLSAFCLKRWQRKFPEILNCCKEYPPVEQAKIQGKTVDYHLFLPKTNTLVFLGEDTYQAQKHVDDKIGGREYHWLLWDKEWLVQASGSNNFLIVHNPSELKHLIHLETLEVGRNKATDTNIPFFESYLDGDMPMGPKNSSHPICYQINQIINFSYSIGVPLHKIPQDELSNLVNGCSSKDQAIVRLAWRFHTEWIRLLESRGETTFDEIFLRFGNLSEDQIYFSKVTHLMIDEFQDISPNLISFISQLKRNLAREHNESSITCVGDDLQSIYGWRGSSASFILKLHSTFRIPENAVSKISLESNYRSAEKILQIGSVITQNIKTKDDKGYIVRRSDLIESEFSTHRGESKKPNYELAAKILEECLIKYSASEKNPIFVLSSKSKLSTPDNQTWSNLLKRNKNKIKCLTMHSSKGLEADCVIALGDIRKPSHHPVRECLYKKAQMPGSYEEMQLDEQNRVAYVAVTRAKKSLHWFFEDRPNNHVDYLLDCENSPSVDTEST